jgi:hypothetical protein
MLSHHYPPTSFFTAGKVAQIIIFYNLMGDLVERFSSNHVGFDWSEMKYSVKQDISLCGHFVN